MDFPSPLISGTLIKRYKRFLSDVILDETGDMVTAHCANPGAMLGIKDEGLKVWLSISDNPKRKLKYSWEIVEAKNTENNIGETLVGINTSHPNKIIEEAIAGDLIEPLTGYAQMRREVKYGTNSRIDILLSDPAKPDCYVEVKNVHLARKKSHAEFPDSVTARGAKHMMELQEEVKKGNRSVMVYLVQREDVDRFSIAGDIDPNYQDAFNLGMEHGVEAYAFSCNVSPLGINLHKALDII
jgi:sugar fermentation stimulation protein A